MPIGRHAWESVGRARGFGAVDGVTAMAGAAARVCGATAVGLWLAGLTLGGTGF